MVGGRSSFVGRRWLVVCRRPPVAAALRLSTIARHLSPVARRPSSPVVCRRPVSVLRPPSHPVARLLPSSLSPPSPSPLSSSLSSSSSSRARFYQTRKHSLNVPLVGVAVRIALRAVGHNPTARPRPQRGPAPRRPATTRAAPPRPAKGKPTPPSTAAAALTYPWPHSQSWRHPTTRTLHHPNCGRLPPPPLRPTPGAQR